jgi:ubiquinone/menaquinone biosynthesis C-methylase UbiE
MGERIELLSPSLLDEHRETVERLRQLARDLGIGLGWHYLQDLAWILGEVSARPGMTVLDAGAGTGVLQWYLADRGVHVLSVDRASREGLSPATRALYRVRELRPGDLKPLRLSLVPTGRVWRRWRKAPRHLIAVARRSIERRARGTVTFHRADLTNLEHVPDASVDHVVAVSALEHNDPDKLPAAVAELMRVLRPGGTLAATLGASPDRDWFHEPSRGWCYSEETLRRTFGLGQGITSNFNRYGEILEMTRQSAELRDNLALFYFESGENGMPWGVWDPKYLSVGVRLDKPT